MSSQHSLMPAGRPRSRTTTTADDLSVYDGTPHLYLIHKIEDMEVVGSLPKSKCNIEVLEMPATRSRHVTSHGDNALTPARVMFSMAQPQRRGLLRPRRR